MILGRYLSQWDYTNEDAPADTTISNLHRGCGANAQGVQSATFANTLDLLVDL